MQCTCARTQAGLRDSINEAKNAVGQAQVLQQHQVRTPCPFAPVQRVSARTRLQRFTHNCPHTTRARH